MTEFTLPDLLPNGRQTFFGCPGRPLTPDYEAGCLKVAQTSNVLKGFNEVFPNNLTSSPPWGNLLLAKYIFMSVTCKSYTHLQNTQLTK